MEQTENFGSTLKSDLEFLKTRFTPGNISLTSTTFRSRRSKSLPQQTLNITNVSQRPLHSIKHLEGDQPARKWVHPPNKPSSTYKISNKPPDRVYLTVQRTAYGGESLVPDEYNDWWDKGEYWNRDSNIRARAFSEIRRKASQAAHDVHRHDQVNHERLASDRENMVNMFKIWKEPRWTDSYNPKPIAAKQSCGVHNALERGSPFGYCCDGEGMRPGAIYMKKYKKMGEAAFRQRNLWVI